MQVLIIEPTKPCTDMLGNILHQTQALVSTTTSVEAGLDLLKERAMDLVVLARRFPNRSAADVVRDIRAMNLHQKTPILVLNEESNAPDRDDCFRAGVTDILNPTNPEAIESSLLRLTDSARQQLQGRVLYVEDNYHDSKVVLPWLRKLGLQVDHFPAAETALDAFLENDYDLVVTDMLRAGIMSGLELVKRIRHLSDSRRRTPVLAMTTAPNQARKAEVLGLGANDLVCKSCTMEEFQARAGNLVRQKQVMDSLLVQKQQLFEIATRDPLTGLYNRNFMMEQADRCISQTRRHDCELCLLIIAVDQFQDIIESHGHAVGDRVLRQVGRLLQNSLRQEDLAARFDGKEFIVILNQCSVQQGRKMAERLRRQLERLNPAGIPVTASIGISAWDGSGETSFDELFRQADLAVYRAKAAGRNQVFAAEKPGSHKPADASPGAGRINVPEQAVVSAD